MPAMTPEALVDALVKHSKTKTWFSQFVDITLPDGTVKTLGIKAYGLWVQRMTCGGLCDGGSSGIHTIRQFKADTLDLIRRVTD